MISKKTKTSFFKSMSITSMVAIGIGSNVCFADIVKDVQENKSITEKPVDDIKGKNSLEQLNDQELIELLTHESFEKRQQATLAVWRRGKPIVETLKDALKSRNPELLSRANKVINYIRVGISPDTPDHIAKLVSSFSEKDKEGKEVILRELYVEKQYSLMLYMLSEMDDQRISRDLYANFNRLAHAAALESIEKGDLDRAIEQLKLAPQNEEIERSLAYLYKFNGAVDAELQRFEKNPANNNKSFELALHLSKGNRSELRKYAQKKGLSRVLATLDLLEGSPNQIVDQLTKKVPFRSKVGLEALKIQYDAEDDYLDLIKSKHEDLLKNLELFEGDTQTDLMKQMVKSLAMTGAKDLLEPYLEKNFKFYAFLHYAYEEDPSKALQIIGIHNDTSLNDYIEKETELAFESYNDLKKKDRFDNADVYRDGPSKLLKLAEFYYDRNHIDKAKLLVAPLLSRVKELKNNEWQNLIASIAEHGMHDVAVDFVIEYSKEDEDLLDDMIAPLFNDTAAITLLWNTLQQRKDVTKEQSFLDMALLMGSDQEKIDGYLKLQDELIRISKNKGAVALKEMRKALSSATLYRQDYISHVKHAKQLLDDDKDTNDENLLIARKNDYLRALSCTTDRESLVEFLDKDRSVLTNSSKRYTIYSIAHRKLGNKEQADKLLEHAKLLSLGLPEKLVEIAGELALAGYHEQYLEIMEQLLLSLSDENRPYVFEAVLRDLAKSDTSYIHTKQWGKAAAFLMSKSVLHMIDEVDNESVEYIGGYLNTFYTLSFTRGMELYQKGEKSKGLTMLNAAHEVLLGSGVLADHFYPAIRTTDLDEQYNQWVEASYQHIKGSLNVFPDCGNTHNTLAWILSRAVRRLDEAIKHSERSHELSPFEAAYIDTMAEVWHAKGNREKAIEWGEKAVTASMYGRLIDAGRSYARYRTFNLDQQLERFRSDPHPNP